jgi:hypothetical protein
MHLPGALSSTWASREHVGRTLNCGDAKVACLGGGDGEGLRDGCLLALLNQLGMAETRY